MSRSVLRFLRVQSKTRPRLDAGAWPRAAAALLAGAAAAAPVPDASALELAQVPLFVSALPTPNILVMLDTSQSMDATMSGKMIRGDDPGTRSNVARGVLKDVFVAYRHAFNWGLGSFALNGSAGQPRATYTYYLGDASTMVFTNTCTNIVDGIGRSDRKGTYTKVVDGKAQVVTDDYLPCVAVPEPDVRKNELAYVTYSRSSDDADVNDVYYAVEDAQHPAPMKLYGSGITGSDFTYRLYKSIDSVTTWRAASTNLAACFNTNCTSEQLNASDAGFQPRVATQPRVFFVKKAFGYSQYITGGGYIDEPVVEAKASLNEEDPDRQGRHYTRLAELLAPEANDAASTMLKNAARATPLAGSLKTSQDYFSGSSSPIRYTCQRNYVVLATDGNPTGKSDGGTYTSSETTNTPSGSGYTFGKAARDVFDQVTALRSTSHANATYDVQTYVIGLGESVINESSVATLNEIARQGGTGSAYLARTGADMNSAFQSIVSDIDEDSAASSSVALNTNAYQDGARVYQAKFNPSVWSGDLIAYPIGSDGTIGAAAWQASQTVTAQNWNTGRAILTYKPSTGAGIAFRPAANPSEPGAHELDRAQIDQLNNVTSSNATGDGFAAQRIAFLRGDTSHEARNVAAGAAPKFRDRLTAKSSTTSNVLGDIVDSTPLYVGAPSQTYRADFAAGSYPAFVRDKAGRTPYLYVGANDGMLHAFRAADGQEKFAYVPNLVFSSLPGLTVPEPSFAHRFNVNGSPAVADVYYGGAWHSLLVSGLRAGGKGLFALDVTDPDAVTEARAAAVVRWEVADAALGHVYAKPLVKRTNDGNWSVIVGNGYNSAAGTAQLLVINAETGAVTKRFDTGVGSSANPNGLSAPVAYDSNDDDVADVVYAGDLYGNLWKFDLSASGVADWSIGVGGAPLFAAGSAKPITAAPDVTRHPRGGVMVAFATGRYLSSTDAADSSTQTAYGVWDNGSSATVAGDQLQPQAILSGTVSASSRTYRFSTHRVGTPTDNQLEGDLENYITRSSYLASKRGWYLNLPTSGERVIADVKFSNGRAVFATLIPSTLACSDNSDGWDLNVDYLTGNRPDVSVFDVNRDFRVNTGDLLQISNTATGSNVASGVQIGLSLSAGVSMSFTSGSEKLSQSFVNPATGRRVDTIVKSTDAADRVRVMWRVVE